MKKVILVALAAAFALTPAFAAGGKEAAKSTGPVTLKMSSWGVVEKGTQDYFAKLQAEFEKDNPGVKVEYVGLPYGNYKQQVLIMAQAGELPDLMQGERSSFPAFAMAGYLADLGSVLPKDYVADLSPALREDLSVDGKLYAAPWFYSGFILFLNKDLFAKAGLNPTSPPKTYTEALSYAEKLSMLKDADGNSVYGLGISTASVPVSGSSLLSMFASFGGGVWDATGKPAFNRQANQAALSFLRILHDKQYNPDGARLKDLRNLFAIGRLAMYFDTLWGLNGVTAINPKAKDFAAAYLPMGEGGNAAKSTLDAHLLMVGATTKRSTEAAKFVQFATSTANLTEYFAISPFLPGRLSVSASDSFAKQPLLAGLKGMDAMIVSVPKHPKIESVLLELAAAAQLATGTRDNVSAIAATADAKIKEILK
jgi:multiple sugar transport system substrate-binding protein